MNKESLIIPIVLTAVIVISIGTCQFVLIHDYSSILDFQRKATEYLGTDNFTVTSWDGLLVAQTSNGTQYPTKTDVDQFFGNQLVIRLELMAVTIAVAISLYFVTYKLSVHSKIKEAKT